MKSSIPSNVFKIATVLENIATCIAALLLIRVHSRPFTVTRLEAAIIQRAFSVIEVGLMTGWIGAVLSIASMSLVLKDCNGGAGRTVKMWGWISILLNVLITITVIAFPRIGAIAGPP